MENKFIIHPRKPPYGKTIVLSARLPAQLVRQLDRAAQKTCRTRNELMVLCMEYALERLEIPESM